MFRFSKFILNCTVIIIAVIASHISLAQIIDKIKLVNPSFEDTPNCCLAPEGWTDCGFSGETPPDVQPAFDENDEPFYGIKKMAFDGKTFLAMVVRESGTYERISQKLERPLQKGHCYVFKIGLCRSDTYRSAVISNPYLLKQFTEPVLFRVWGGDSFCNDKNLLIKSEPIINTEWKEYVFLFNAGFEISHIQLEAFFNPQKNETYNGNLLLDNASNIIEIDCNAINKK